jgi:glycosyltransferase involved in cell wall biosynthesis
VLDRAAVAQRYREADLFTLPCLDTAFGGAFAEAMASGLPIVGGAAGGLPELVHDGQNGLLVRPGDPIAIASAIRRLLESPGLRADMGRRNRSDAEAQLSWERVTERHLALYAGVQRHVPARRLLTEQPSGTW